MRFLYLQMSSRVKEEAVSCSHVGTNSPRQSRERVCTEQGRERPVRLRLPGRVRRIWAALTPIPAQGQSLVGSMWR